MTTTEAHLATPTTEILFDGMRIAFEDSDGDGVWFTKVDAGVTVECDDTYILLTPEQADALAKWLSQ